MSPELGEAVVAALGEAGMGGRRFVRWERLGGGCIHDAQALVTDQERYFVKSNKALLFGGHYESQAKALVERLGRG